MDRHAFEAAYSQFWDEIDGVNEPGWKPVSYGMCDLVSNNHWPSLSGLASMMILDDLRETINFLNSWRGRLFKWSVWLKVISGRSEDDMLALAEHFVEPLAFFCMLQPSAMRDRFVHVATNAIHQVNLAINNAYPDQLDQDHEGFLNRRKSTDQLKRIGKGWRNFDAFDNTLRMVDSTDYRKATCNFRNLSSHAIPPRFEWGETNFVTRGRVPKTSLVKQADGTFQEIQDEKVKVTTYSFGGMPPLGLAKMLEVNQREHELASATFEAYSTLLQEMLDSMALRSHGDSLPAKTT